MAIFSTEKVLNGNPSLIPTIADRIVNEFQMQGFTAKSDSYAGGVYDISLTKGNVFKAVLGMKSALKVTLTPNGNNIHIKAGVGIFGQQAIPTAITMFAFWPVLIPQIWGMVQQSKLDDQTVSIAEQVVNENGRASFYHEQMEQTASFCPNCGNKITGNVNFCPQCGSKI
jgi:DNA-directed RNA polymerase subunit RPC12/RpoP